MPQITDPLLIRRELEKEPSWTAYALADLEPDYFGYTAWFQSADKGALLLVYRGFARPVLLCIGATQDWRPLLDEADAILSGGGIYVVARPEVFGNFRGRYRIAEERPMQRMVLQARSPALPGSLPAVTRLGRGDIDAIKQLYGEEPPEFFQESMLSEGCYYGIYEGELLAAVAGTHIIAPSVNVAGLGNIYTRRDCRNRGYSTRVTRAVTQQLIKSGIRTIVLNVREDNHTAIRVYERIGFNRYCRYFEGKT
jgi:GNAT superfamily N-acetyltransferase